MRTLVIAVISLFSTQIYASKCASYEVAKENKSVSEFFSSSKKSKDYLCKVFPTENDILTVGCENKKKGTAIYPLYIDGALPSEYGHKAKELDLHQDDFKEMIATSYETRCFEEADERVENFDDEKLNSKMISMKEYERHILDHLFQLLGMAEKAMGEGSQYEQEREREIYKRSMLAERFLNGESLDDARPPIGDGGGSDDDKAVVE